MIPSRDLETLKQYKTRSPYSDVADSSQMLTVYRRGDVQKRYEEMIESTINHDVFFQCL